MPFDFTTPYSDPDHALRLRIAAVLDGWKPAELPPIRRGPGLIDLGLSLIRRAIGRLA